MTNKQKFEIIQGGVFAFAQVGVNILKLVQQKLTSAEAVALYKTILSIVAFVIFLILAASVKVFKFGQDVRDFYTFATTPCPAVEDAEAIASYLITVGDLFGERVEPGVTGKDLQIAQLETVNGGFMAEVNGIFHIIPRSRKIAMESLVKGYATTVLEEILCWIAAQIIDIPGGDIWALYRSYCDRLTLGFRLHLPFDDSQGKCVECREEAISLN